MALVSTLLPAARGETALDAIKELPKDQAARIARIEGRDGAPNPDRWYILTQDPAADNGVHEFVVAKGEVVASRSLSQFADNLKPGDMLGAVPLTIDSDKAAKLARDYADVNGTSVATMNYELKNNGPDGTPAWTISCLDDQGNKVGEIVVTAAKGEVVSHHGFTVAPEPVAEAAVTPDATPKKKKEQPRFETYAKPEVAPVATGPADENGTQYLHGQPPAKKTENPVGKTLDNVGRTLHKFLPF